WINRFEDGEANSPAVHAEMVGQLRALVLHHTAGRDPAQPWGWKEPRSIYLLPFFHEQLPTMRFLHVVRDGRDMAYSSNRTQLKKHGEAVLGDTDAADELRAVSLWADVNLRAADFGERVLGDRYLRVRFEDICVDTEQTVAQIARFFELELD